ncbi:hypothetical protein QE250_00595 [Chromatiaceae bacterium AAb-1]|nr:hypothetical protein [Chromatiaceae bacterium AAb-1]
MRYSAGVIILIVSGLLLGGCMGQGSSGTDRLPPEPLVEPIDPQTNPVAAVRAREQRMEHYPDVKAMRADVMKLIADTRADNAEQCRVVGFGHKPCGGPARYIAFSVKHASEQEVMARIGEYNTAAQAENIRLGLMSDCAIVPEPAVTLKNGRCTLVDTKTNSF